MTSLFVMGAARSGVSILARAVAHEEGLPLCADLAGACEQIADGKRVVALAADETPDCTYLSSLPRILAERDDVRAIVVWRQGVDFVNSRLRARPGTHFAEHCRLWARSFDLAQRLHSQFQDRVDLIEFRTLIDRSEPDARERTVIRDFNLTRQTFHRFTNASAHGRTSLMPRRPVIDAARAAWSMGEVEAFARVCGEAMLSTGAAVDLASARRRRPIDLGRTMYERAYRVGGVAISPSRIPDASWRIDIDTVTPSGAQLRLNALAADGRRRLRLSLRAKVLLACDFSCEIVESLTRRPLFVVRELGRHEPNMLINAILPANDGMVDIAMSFSNIAPGRKIELEIIRSELAHL